MRFPLKVVGIVAALALATAGCGDSEDNAAEPTTIDLSGLLARAEEAPGFAPEGSPETFDSLDDLVDKFDLTEEERERLDEHVFVAETTTMLTGTEDDAAGINTIDVFETDKGAKAELEYLIDNKEKDAPKDIKNFERFTVSGVPGATGWTYDKPGGSKAGDVYWRQGRCVMSLGIEPVDVDTLKTGVKAIYDRTGGRCP